MKIRITLIEEMLGTKAADPEVFATFIASKHPSGTPQRDELDNAEKREESGTTVFHRQDGKVGIYNYQMAQDRTTTTLNKVDEGWARRDPSNFGLW